MQPLELVCDILSLNEFRRRKSREVELEIGEEVSPFLPSSPFLFLSFILFSFLFFSFLFLYLPFFPFIAYVFKKP